MKNPLANLTNPTLIAPCGINCRLCRAYIRDKKSCPGCRADDTGKAISCISCKIKNCAIMRNGHIEYCYQCEEFPCQRVKNLDKRYRAKYGTSVIENLKGIEHFGIFQFIENENKKWTCPACGALICMHHSRCLSCGYAWLELA